MALVFKKMRKMRKALKKLVEIEQKIVNELYFPLTLLQNV